MVNNQTSGLGRRPQSGDDTVLGHVEKLVWEGKINPRYELAHLKPKAKRFEKMKEAFKKSGGTKLTPVRELLGETYNFEELRLARLFL